jgi:hypothetical protein
MALAFFRRRQKMVMIIMAVLMVSFLIGFQGFETVLHKDPGKRSVGRTRAGEISRNDLMAAENELRLLNYVNYADVGFQLLYNNNDQPVLVYAMLLQEAQDSPVRVSSEDVSTFLMRNGWVGAELQSRMATIKSRLGERVTERHLRDAVANWLRVSRVCEQSLSLPPVSRPEAEGLYRDLSEKIKVKVAAIRAEDFLDQVGEPNEAAVTAQFTEFRAALPGQYSQTNPFGFGYVQPDRLKTLYLLVRGDVILRASEPSEETIREYYRRHAAELVKNVPAEPTPAGAGATQATSKPAEQRRVPMSFAEAKTVIARQLTEQAAQAKMDELATRSLGMLENLAKSAAATGVANPYQQVRDGMTTAAEAILARRLEGLKIDGEPLAQAVKTLADKAGLEAIVFPWGDLGDRKLDPAVKVKLSAAAMTLGEALDRIAEQIKWPKLHWATSPEFKDVLFSVGDKDGVDFFPVVVRETGLMDASALRSDPVLGKAATASGQPLGEIAFNAEPFVTQGRRGGSMLKVNDDGPRMDVGGEPGGKLLWRMIEAVPAHAPMQLEEVEGLGEQVKKDCRLKAAFELAVKRAEAVKASAAKSGLEAAAKQEKLKLIETGLFPRRVATSPLRQYAAMVQKSGRLGPEMFARLAMQPPIDFPFSSVAPLSLPGEFAYTRFIDAVFALAPASVEPPYPKAPPSVGLLPLPSAGEVLVMERTDYEPAVWGLYQQAMGEVVRQLDELRRWQGKMVWFTGKAVADRMEYKPLIGAEG